MWRVEEPDRGKGDEGERDCMDNVAVGPESFSFKLKGFFYSEKENLCLDANFESLVCSFNLLLILYFLIGSSSNAGKTLRVSAILHPRLFPFRPSHAAALCGLVLRSHHTSRQCGRYWNRRWR